ncbi:MAG: hypothetical protein ACOCYW_09475 [Roseicyclus sp.]
MPLLLAACQPVPQPGLDAPLRHEGVETLALGENIVNLTLRMSGPATDEDLLAYADCAVAGYALRQGFGFARHVRTNTQNEGSLRVADAIYTVSPTLPRGLQTIDAEVMASNCAEQGIPTV